MSFLPKQQLQELKAFVGVLKAKPEIIHDSDLSFFKDYLESLGADLPPVPKSKEKKEEAAKDVPQDEPMPPEEEQDPESDLELDMSGVVEADPEEPHEMGDPNKGELTDEESDKFDDVRGQAMAAFSEGEWSKAIDLFTEAIKLNPQSAAMFAKRGTCYLKLKKPNACIRDCDRAIELNPDNAAAHKFRGRSHRLLGHFKEAAKDLRLACKIDFDDQANEWLKEVTPNAKKIEEHERKMERKREEKEIREKKERVRKAREAQQAAKAAAEAEGDGLMDFLRGQQLQRSNGSLVPANVALANKQIVLFYFSAHWCPPCRAFTPLLKDFYEEVEDEGVEIIFVSSDHSAKDMAAYMNESHGSWLAIPHGSHLAMSLSQKYSVSGIPCLVVVRKSDGKLISKDGRMDVQTRGPQAVKEWKRF